MLYMFILYICICAHEHIYLYMKLYIYTPIKARFLEVLILDVWNHSRCFYVVHVAASLSFFLAASLERTFFD